MLLGLLFYLLDFHFSDDMLAVNIASDKREYQVKSIDILLISP